MSDATIEIKKKYEELDGRKGFLGAPVLNCDTDELILDTTAHQHYEHGVIYYSPKTGAHEVHGAILVKYKALPETQRRKFGLPTSDEIRPPGDYIRYSTFQGGTIVWSHEAGARVLDGQINKKWLRLTEEVRRQLGYPTTDRISINDGIGVCIHFSNGAIYWTSDLGAHVVYGRIYAKWRELGWEITIGYPTDDVTRLVFEGGSPSGEVCPFQNTTLFDRDGWPQVYSVTGEFLRVLRAHGGERVNGFPASDAFDPASGDPASAGGRLQDFDFCMILSKPGCGTRYIPREIRGEYTRMRTATGCLGYPRSDYAPVPGNPGRYYQLFEHGRIDFNSVTGTATSHCDTTGGGGGGSITHETDTYTLLEKQPFWGGLAHYQATFLGRVTRLQNTSGRDFIFLKYNPDPSFVRNALLYYAVRNADGTLMVPESNYIYVLDRGFVNATDLRLPDFPVIHAGLISRSGGGGDDGAPSYTLHVWYQPL